MKTLADLTAPAPVVRKLLEKDVQKQCVEWARTRGYWARKFSSQSQRSVPDYLFAKAWTGSRDNYCSIDSYPIKLKFACEFKAPGKKPTEAQYEEIKLMLSVGWHVIWVDNFEAFKSQVQALERIQHS